MVQTQLRFSRPDGTYGHSLSVLNFTFTKDAYTPYTQVSASFLIDNGTFSYAPEEYSEVTFYVNSCQVHRGIIDSFSIIRDHTAIRGVVRSRGFTSMLLDNQLKPGLYTNISINNLIDDYYTLYNVTHEKSNDKSYIYVKSGSSMWDAIVNLSYKLYGTYPHIQGPNKVMMTKGSPARHVTFDDNTLISCGAEINTRRIASHFHMADVDDTYGNFEYVNQDAIDRNITRHRYFDLDRRFLYDPESAVIFRDAMASRGMCRKICTYSGYKKEDLYDTVSFEDVTDGIITSIKITGDRSGVQTELSIYNDKFTK